MSEQELQAYDILPPPVMVFSPTWQVWLITILILLFTAAILYLLLHFIKNRKASSNTTLNLDQLIKAFYELSKSEVNKYNLTAANLSLKRYLAMQENLELASFTSNELIKYSEKLNPNTYKLLELLCQTEEFNYSASINQVQAKNIIKEIYTALKQTQSLPQEQRQ